MNKLAMAVATAFLLLSTHSQAATVIQDVFWGAGIDGELNTGNNLNLPEDSGDVYDFSQTDRSVKSKFDIDSAEATLTQNSLTLAIKSSLYFSSWIDGSIADAPGDLYLSTAGWNPNTTIEHYGADDSTSGTAWNYVVSLSRISEDINGVVFTSGNATLHKIGTTDEPLWGWDRSAQEVRTYFNANATSYGTGSWRYTTETNGDISLLIEIDLRELLGVDWDGTTPLGFHFTMDCGNDVIEGSIAPVPLPSTCLLLGSALVGLMGVARRKIR